MRQFRDFSCSQFQTVELPREVEARKRRQKRAQAKQLPASTGKGVRSAGELTAASSSNSSIPASTAQPTPSNVSPTSAAPSSTSTSHKLKTLNIFTYKFHSLGDYVRTIRLFGGTDSFSTQLVRFFYSGYYFIEADLGYSLG
jgi:hypothetical protein